MISLPRCRGTVAILAGLLMASAGCGPELIDTPTAQRLRGLADLYLKYASGKGAGGVGPRDEAEFRRFLKRLPAEMAEYYAVDKSDPEAMLVSPVDGQPFVVYYGLNAESLSPKSAPVLAHESAGARRVVVFLNSKVALVAEADLPDLIQKPAQ